MRYDISSSSDYNDFLYDIYYSFHDSELNLAKSFKYQDEL